MTHYSYDWPYVDDSLNDVVLGQVRRSLSDQSAAGIIGDFEAAFSDFLGVRECLAFSSGTAAIHAMVAAAALKPGDEIICGAYGFFASVSPFAYEGVVIRFVDVGPDGNIDLVLAERAITHRTRAIMAVHLWGVPCDVNALRRLCDRHNLLLFEDCSHAHFAKSQGRRVGTLADLAAFSFNQKALTCGEGGVLVCREPRMREEALLFGHYNKRCFAEVRPPQEKPDFRLTGYGLKLRPHTIAMAIGTHQVRMALDIEHRRRRNLETFRASLDGHPVLRIIDGTNPGDELGLYVLPLQVVNCDIKEQGKIRALIFDFLLSSGADLVDIPNSTGVMNFLPLFNKTEDASRNASVTFEGAESFSNSIMKLPLWGYPGDQPAVKFYADCLSKTRELFL